MEKNIINQEVLKVRCPQCFKLYNVHAHSIQTKKPKFKCNQCHEGFSLSYPECLGMDEVIGFADSWEESLKDPLELDSMESPPLPITQKDSEVNLTEEKNQVPQANIAKQQKIESPAKDEIRCVKCGALNKKEAVECSNCGVVFSKFKLHRDDPIAAKAPQKLKEIWQMVTHHYEDEDLHDEFIRQCRKANQLEFASSRYSKILEAQPNESTALNYKNRIIALASAPIERELKIERKRFRVPFTSLIMLMSAIVMFMGYMMPELRNLMGIGAAFLFVTTAIRLIFK